MKRLSNRDLYPIVNGPMPKVLNIIDSELSVNKKGCIVNFCYFASFRNARIDTRHGKALKSSNIVLIDGIAMQIYFYIVSGKWLYNNNGTDLNPLILEYFLGKVSTVVFYGSSAANIGLLREKVRCKFPRYEDKCQFSHGYQNFDISNVKDNSLVFVALGSPKQELWVESNSDIIKRKNLLVVTVGGWFDFYSGSVKRAPKIIIKCKCEWLYRFFKEPKKNYRKVLSSFHLISFSFLDLLHSRSK